MSKEENYTEAKLLRIKAEEQLKKKQDSIGIPTTKDDEQKLLDELQVHQIELERQN